MTEVSRGDVVLVAFPYVAGLEAGHKAERKRRPALVVQSDRYNRRRAAIIIAAVASTQAHRELPAKSSAAKTRRRVARWDFDSTASSTVKRSPRFLATRSSAGWVGSHRR